VPETEVVQNRQFISTHIPHLSHTAALVPTKECFLACMKKQKALQGRFGCSSSSTDSLRLFDEPATKTGHTNQTAEKRTSLQRWRVTALA